MNNNSMIYINVLWFFFLLVVQLRNNYVDTLNQHSYLFLFCDFFFIILGSFPQGSKKLTICAVNLLSGSVSCQHNLIMIQ